MRQISLLSLIILLSIAARAQIFYKITSPGYPDSYILGTHHLAPLSVIDSIPSLPGALASCDALYGEIDMEELTDPANMRPLMQAMTAPADSTLDRLLSPEDLDRLSAVLARYSPVPLPRPCPMKPAAITNLIITAVSAGSIPAENIDMAMQSRARALGIPVAALETPASQVRLLYGAPISEQLTELMATVDSIGQIKANIDSISLAYASHDMEAIARAINQTYADDPDGYRRLVTDRNAAWLAVLIPELRRRSLMIAVGAAHLPGPDGLIAGLRDAGFTVTPAH